MNEFEPYLPRETRRVPRWARDEHLERIAPLSELARYGGERGPSPRGFLKRLLARIARGGTYEDRNRTIVPAGNGYGRL